MGYLLEMQAAGAVAAQEWETRLRDRIRAYHGFGWTLRGVGVGNARTKLTLRDPDDGTRTNVTLDIPWRSDSGQQISSAIADIKRRMDGAGMSFRDAYAAIAPAEGKTYSNSWTEIRDKCLESKKDRRATTLNDYRQRIGLALQSLSTAPKPTDGTSLLRAIAKQHLGHLEPGSVGRARTIGDVAAFLRFAVDRCGAPLKWLPPKPDVIREIVGAADASKADAAVTPPVKDDDLSALLDAMEAAGQHELRLATGLIALFGLRPAELSVMRMGDDGHLRIGKIKRNQSDFNKSAKEQIRDSERLVLPLDLLDKHGLGMQLAAQWHSGLVKLPRKVQRQIDLDRGFKRIGDAYATCLREFQPWRDLVAANPGTTPYSLRHSWAWRSATTYDRSMSPRNAAKLMGHNLKIHFDHYGHYTDTEELLKAWERLVGPQPTPVGR